MTDKRLRSNPGEDEDEGEGGLVVLYTGSLELGSCESPVSSSSRYRIMSLSLYGILQYCN